MYKVAQCWRSSMVEQWFCKPPVAGSIPIASFLVGFPSGQRDQTVNLTAKPSKVQILPPPPCGCSSIGRASAFQAEGHGFETRHPLFFMPT